jgi:hypothetical protein
MKKTVQLEPSCYMRTDGRTDLTELAVAFRNFVKAPKNYPSCPQITLMCFV